MKKRNSAFTLVELIVVITILSILATIWFLSYKSYTIDSRDTNRITNLNTIHEWLKVSKLTNGRYVKPDDFIYISWLWYQWYAWENVKTTIKSTWNMKDPSDNKYYLYLLSSNTRKIQLAWFLENQQKLAFVNNAYAWSVDYSERFIYTVWDEIWIAIDSTTKTPLNEILSWSITLSSYTWSLSLYLNSNESISWTWRKLTTD